MSSVASAPQPATPLGAVVAAFERAGAVLQERRKYSRQRQAVIAANASLQERELIKLAAFASALAEALRRGGVEDPPARLTAEVAIAVFRTPFERWHEETDPPDLRQLFRESFDELTLMERRLSRVNAEMPAAVAGISCRSGGGGLAWCATRGQTLIRGWTGWLPVSAGPGFVLRASLSKIERGPRAACSQLDR